MSRKDDLEQMRERLLVRLDGCESDQNFATMGRLFVDVVKQLAELSGETSAAGQRRGLSEFEKKLRERERPAAGAGRTVG